MIKLSHKKIVEKHLDEIFSNDKNENEGRIEVFIDENKTKVGELGSTCPSTIFVYQKLLTLVRYGTFYTFKYLLVSVRKM